jgi:hypothetical protein
MVAQRVGPVTAGRLRLIDLCFWRFLWHWSELSTASLRPGWRFLEKSTNLTVAEWCVAEQLGPGLLLAQTLRSQSNSVWQLVHTRQRRSPLNQPERTR